MGKEIYSSLCQGTNAILCIFCVIMCIFCCHNWNSRTHLMTYDLLSSGKNCVILSNFLQWPNFRFLWFPAVCRKCIRKKLSDEEMECCPVCNIDLGCVPLEKLRSDFYFSCLSESVDRLVIFLSWYTEKIHLHISIPYTHKLFFSILSSADNIEEHS